jgi:hypothetical protein
MNRESSASRSPDSARHRLIILTPELSCITAGRARVASSSGLLDVMLLVDSADYVRP